MPIVTEGGAQGGGFSPVVANLARDADFDIHAVGTYQFSWDNLVDNEWDYNTTSFPTGLGLTASFDGSSPNITTTEAGIWVFTGTVVIGAADASIRGQIFLPFAGFGTLFGPLGIAGNITVCQALNLPAGATDSMKIGVSVGAAANPLNVHGDLNIVRLA